MIYNNYTPLVTVAMVTYNSEKYVGMAIESVLASSYKNFELLISDDCSTDNTWQIINEYQDYRIIATQNKTTLKEYPNRNKCIESANGTYIIFIDGDDYIYPHGLEFMVNSMLEFPDAAMGLSRPYDARFIFPKRLLPEETIQLHFYSKTVLDLAMIRNIFKTESVKKVGMFPANYFAGDYYLRLHLAKSYPCVLIIDGLVWWRLRPDQASERMLKKDAGLIENLKMEIDFIKGLDFPTMSYKGILKKLNQKVISILRHRLFSFQFYSFFRILKFTLVNRLTN